MRAFVRACYRSKLLQMSGLSSQQAAESSPHLAVFSVSLSSLEKMTVGANIEMDRVKSFIPRIVWLTEKQNAHHMKTLYFYSDARGWMTDSSLVIFLGSVAPHRCRYLVIVSSAPL